MQQKLNNGVPVDYALKQMGVTNPSLINEIKDDLSYHAINSGAHVPKVGVDVNTNGREPGVQGRTDPSVVDVNVNGKPAYNGQNGDIDINVPSPGDVFNAGANAATNAAGAAANAIAHPVDTAANVAGAAANAVNDGAKALMNMFGR